MPYDSQDEVKEEIDKTEDNVMPSEIEMAPSMNKLMDKLIRIDRHVVRQDFLIYYFLIRVVCQ